MKNKIIPSSPFKDYGELETLAMKAKGEVKRIQIDVCDGEYVKNVSWPFTEYKTNVFETLNQKNDFDVFLPFWENLDYSVDLMVNHPERYIESFVAYGIDQVVIHFRTLDEKNWKELVDMCEKFQIEMVLAVDLKSNLQDFIKFVETADQEVILTGLQVMGIENIGKSGQDFAPEALEIVKILRGKFSHLPIYFDGGISEATVEDVKKAGVEVFCVGSYLTQSPDFTESLQVLKKILH